MKYSLDLDEPLPDEVRRIASARLSAALALLRSQPEGLDTAVHGARRHIKQCRSLHRLVASALPGAGKAEDARLGRIGRRLSSMRDASALVEAANYLRHEARATEDRSRMERLATRLEQRRNAAEQTHEAVAERLGSVIGALDKALSVTRDLALPAARRKRAACLAHGWDRTGCKIREALEATADGHDEAFHDLRKRIQDRWMQAGMLETLWPTAMIAIQRQAKYVSDLLGHAQDLTMLLEAVSGDDGLAGDAVEGKAIDEAIRRQRMDLRERCRALARDLSDQSRPRDRATIERLLLDR